VAVYRCNNRDPKWAFSDGSGGGQCCRTVASLSMLMSRNQPPGSRAFAYSWMDLNAMNNIRISISFINSWSFRWCRLLYIKEPSQNSVMPKKYRLVYFWEGIVKIVLHVLFWVGHQCKKLWCQTFTSLFFRWGWVRRKILKWVDFLDINEFWDCPQVGKNGNVLRFKCIL
jgi:hypothetical protein